ncbi:flavin reductase family protein [Streptomyces caniferus]|uniref:Monooxygenase n=1 Tax=Streptomyces caniferus TaxID=285557 RepID=A0A640SA17_9ACTN|nr:flavin reductase family protein [Streptomyces caniferus]GFE06415.1 monooxygenase [Streptomyces caniferus]
MTDPGTTLLDTPDTATFRAAMGAFPTGVTLLTQGSGDGTIVMTLNSLASVSLDPLLILVSVKKDGRMRPRIRRGGGYAVNVLGEQHRDLSSEFARPDRPEGQRAMTRIGAVEGTTGNAVVPSAVAAFECRLETEYEAGDHVLLIGRVVAVHRAPDAARPLVFHQGRYTRLSATGETA